MKNFIIFLTFPILLAIGYSIFCFLDGKIPNILFLILFLLYLFISFKIWKMIDLKFGDNEKYKNMYTRYKLDEPKEPSAISNFFILIGDKIELILKYIFIIIGYGILIFIAYSFFSWIGATGVIIILLIMILSKLK